SISIRHLILSRPPPSCTLFPYTTLFRSVGPNNSLEAGRHAAGRKRTSDADRRRGDAGRYRFRYLPHVLESLPYTHAPYDPASLPHRRLFEHNRGRRARRVTRREPLSGVARRESSRPLESSPARDNRSGDTRRHKSP